MRFPTTASAIGIATAMACAACAGPSEPIDLFQQLTGADSAVFALAVLDDPEDTLDQRGSVIARDDGCDAAGNPLRTFITDTIVLYRDRRAGRIVRSETPDADHGQGHSFRGVLKGTWEPFAPEGWFYYSDGPSIRLSLALEPSALADLYFRVLSATKISTTTQVGAVNCPKNPNPGHSVLRDGFLRYERL